MNKNYYEDNYYIFAKMNNKFITSVEQENGTTPGTSFVVVLSIV
jgi:hypothetical protein